MDGTDNAAGPVVSYGGEALVEGDSGRYEELLKLVDSVEAAQKPGEATFIDMTNVMPQQPVRQQRTYAELEGLIEAVESGRHPAPREVAERKTAQPSPHLITSGVSQTFYSTAQPQVTPQPAVQRQTLQERTELLKKQREGVAKELGAIAGKLSTFKPKLEFEFRKKKIKTEDLVLPSLSLADQISEVERIIEGLREKVFDAEHLEVVSQEIYGLQQTVGEQKRTQSAQLSQLEKSLWDLRDQRISEAVSLLKGGN